MNTLIKRDADDSFPEYVVHMASPRLRLRVVKYGARPNAYGMHPVVATDDNGSWFAGEAGVEAVLYAVNGYGDQVTAEMYAKERIWTTEWIEEEA